MKHYFKKNEFSNWLINKKEERIAEISIDHFHHFKNVHYHEKETINCKYVFEKGRKQITNIETSGADESHAASMLEKSKYYPGQIPHLPSLYLPKRVSAPIAFDEPMREFLNDIKFFALSQKLSKAVIGVRHLLELKWSKENVSRGDCDFVPAWEGISYKYRWRMYVKGGEIYDCIQGRGVPNKDVLLSPLADNIVARSTPSAYRGQTPKNAVLAPAALSFLLERILEPNLKGENVVNDRFFVKSKDIGRPLFGNLEVTDSPCSPYNGGNELFDFEGCVRRSKILISRGTVVNTLMNLDLFNKRGRLKLNKGHPGNAASPNETSSSGLEVTFPGDNHLNFEDGIGEFCYITRLTGPHCNPSDGRFTLRCDVPIVFHNGKIRRLPPMIISGNLFEIISDATVSKPFCSGKMKLPFLYSKTITKETIT